MKPTKSEEIISNIAAQVLFSEISASQNITQRKKIYGVSKEILASKNITIRSSDIYKHVTPKHPIAIYFSIQIYKKSQE
jgi:hypothetical protein